MLAPSSDSPQLPSLQSAWDCTILLLLWGSLQKLPRGNSEHRLRGRSPKTRTPNWSKTAVSAAWSLRISTSLWLSSATDWSLSKTLPAPTHRSDSIPIGPLSLIFDVATVWINLSILQSWLLSDSVSQAVAKHWIAPIILISESAKGVCRGRDTGYSSIYCTGSWLLPHRGRMHFKKTLLAPLDRYWEVQCATLSCRISHFQRASSFLTRSHISTRCCKSVTGGLAPSRLLGSSRSQHAKDYHLQSANSLRKFWYR
jgi:hypothetical protein